MSALKLIITKEFNQRVKKKSFIISTLIAPLFFAFMMVAPALLVTYGTDNESTASNIMVVDKTDSIGRELHSGDAVKYDLKNISEDDGKEIVKNSASYQALLVIQPNDQFLLYTKQQLSIQTLDIINSNVTDIVRQHKIKSYDIKNIDAIIADINVKIDMKSYKLTEEGEKKVSNAVPIATGFIFSILIYMFILMYGNQVSMSVIDEKSSRVVELIVSQVKPFWLMMGKIIGIGLVGLTQFVIWMGLSLIISSIVKSVIMPDIDITQLSSSTDALRQAGISDSMQAALATIADPMYLIRVLGCFIIFFIGGYMLYGAMFAAVGSAVDNVQEVGQFTVPITMPLILSVVMVMFAAESPQNSIAVVMSYIPFTSPVVMMARIPSDTVSWYEIIISISILFASIVGATYIAAKIFRVGIFMYGKKVSWKEVSKWIRYN